MCYKTCRAQNTFPPSHPAMFKLSEWRKNLCRARPIHQRNQKHARAWWRPVSVQCQCYNTDHTRRQPSKEDSVWACCSETEDLKNAVFSLNPSPHNTFVCFRSAFVSPPLQPSRHCARARKLAAILLQSSLHCGTLLNSVPSHLHSPARPSGLNRGGTKLKNVTGIFQ